MKDEKQVPEPSPADVEGASGPAGILGALVLTVSPFLLLLGMWWVDRLFR